MTDLQRAYEALVGKLTPYTTLFAYADGDQPLIYSAARLRETFRSLTARFSQNWCAVVVNAALDRIVLKGFAAEESGNQDALKDLWNQNQLQIEAEQVHEAALITHEAFIIAWPGEDGKPEIYYNDPRACQVFYSADNPRKKEFAAKWYLDGEDRYHLTLYYPDRLEYYVTRNKFKNGPPASANAFQVDKDTQGGVAQNTYGVIPIFHFRTNRRSHNGELDSILTLQDAVNKLLADMMIAAEFGAFRQRWVISQAETKDLKNAPNEIWVIPPGMEGGQQSSVGEFQGTDLNNYLNAIDKIANSIAIISRTPKHYFFSSGSSPSGEALIAMEAPLNKKVTKIEESFAVIWQELAAFLLLLSGKGEVDPTTLSPIWAPVQSVQPYTAAMTAKTMTDAGVPLVTELRRQGWGEDELDQMAEDQKEDQAKQPSLATLMLTQARTRQEQSNAPVPGQEPRPAPMNGGAKNAG